MRPRSRALLILLLCALVIGGGSTLSACGDADVDSTVSTTPSVTDNPATTTGSTEAGPLEKTLTLVELAEFDGQDGRQAYVAVDGVVYDVSNSSAWRGGEHDRCGLGATAGRDLSKELEQAPRNMRALVEAMPVVGRLAE